MGVPQKSSARGRGPAGSTDLIEHVGLAELSFEVGRASQDEPGHVDLVPGDEELHGRLGHLAHVVVPLLHAQAGEAQGRLPSSACREGHGDTLQPKHTAGPRTTARGSCSLLHSSATSRGWGCHGTLRE